MHPTPGRAFLVAAAAVTTLLFATSPDTASAFPSNQQDCSQCHGLAGVFPNPINAVASASVLTPAQGYGVAISMDSPGGGATGTGFWIANSDASGATGTTTQVFAGGAGQGSSGQWTATMTAPDIPGVYFYKVFGQSGPFGVAGDPGFALYSIEVAWPAPSATVTVRGPTATGITEPAIPSATPTPPPIATAVASPCRASCDGQPDVTVDQVLVAINIVLGAADPSACSSFDANGDTHVGLDELALALDASLHGCPSEQPSAPAATVTPTVSAVASGEELYLAYCAVCHERTSPAYVGNEVYGESAPDMMEALAQVTAMRSLGNLLTTDDIAHLAAYLGTLDDGDDDDADTHE